MGHCQTAGGRAERGLRWGSEIVWGRWGGTDERAAGASGRLGIAKEFVRLTRPQLTLSIAAIPA